LGRKTDDSSDAQFHIAFPGNPTPSQEDSNASEDGSKFISYKLTASPASGVVYTLNWWENPAQKDKSADELFANFRDCNLKIFGERPSTKNKSLARDTRQWTPSY